MALCYMRLFSRRSIDHRVFRNLYTSSPNHVAASLPKLATGSPICETHDEKNARLKRPMSPHLTIYQIQLTSLLSITHRGTGMLLSTYSMVLGLGTILIPGGIPCLIEMIEDQHLSPAILFAMKFLLALPATYHTLNGFRHLAWDLGAFLTIKEVYTTGFAVIILSTIAAAVLAAM